MWYFAWILGICVACGFGVINGVARELRVPDPGQVAE